MAGKRNTSGLPDFILNTVSIVAGLVFLLAVAYTWMLLFGDSFRVYPVGFNTVTSNRLTHDVNVAGRVMLWSGSLFTLAFLILNRTVRWVRFVPLAIGLILYLGLPLLSAGRMSSASLNPARQNHPGLDLLTAWRETGIVVGGLGVLAVGLLGISALQESLAAPRRRTVPGLKLPFYSACWQTHHCKPEINRLCAPGREGFRKSCWRHKNGCFCDASLADRVLEQARHRAGKKAPSVISRPAAAPEPTFWDRFRSTSHRVKGQMRACAECPIYLYHETQKHRIVAPIVCLAVPVVMYFMAGQARTWYHNAITAADTFMLEHVAYSPTAEAMFSDRMRDSIATPTIEIMLYLVLGIFLLTFAARAVEFWCFTAKL
ncbi:MAG: hypothetical protein GYA63_06435 [Armatimonadetes bacterium]|mgnify:CR=1 FL=1|nr:hypothetical protein [Armatimonadota bacterium]HOC30927.1 hypothetical protein [Armatimonadota bacterium]